MTYLCEHSEFQLKKRNFFLLLIAGGCASAFAQAPAFSLPSLPPLPSVKYETPVTTKSLAPANIPAASSAIASLPPLPTIAATSVAPLPSLGGLPSLPGVAAPKPVVGDPMPIVLNGNNDADQAVATVPDVQVDVNATPLTDVNASSQNIQPLPMPGDPSAAPNTPLPKADVPTLIFPVEGMVEKATSITWGTRLAPSVIPKKTDFKYKRDLLSKIIYRTEYDKNNRHLPSRITRDDYSNLLFNSIAKNDINATRALLNAGVSVDSTNPYGETPLMLAERLQATQVAALLVARGAKN